MGEGELKKFETYIRIDEKEIPLKKVENISICSSPIVNMRNSAIKEYISAQENKSVNDYLSASATIEMDLKDFNKKIRQIRRLFGDYTVSQKRARKLLMSKGYSRNEANYVEKLIRPRLRSTIDMFAPKNFKIIVDKNVTL